MTEREIIRDRVQREVVKAWTDQGFIGYSTITMGTGKSRIIAMAVNAFMQSPQASFISDCEIPICILENSKYLRDKELPAELKKWGCNHPVKIACYQSAHRWKKRIGLMIADELDFAFTESEKYINSFTNNSIYFFLGLTGSFIPDKLQKATTLFQRKPFYEYTLQQAQADGVINKTQIWIHDVPMGTTPTPDAKWGEASKYIWIATKLKEIADEITIIYDNFRNRRYSQVEEIHAETRLKELKGLKQFWESSGKNSNSRLKLLRSLQSTKVYATTLKQRLLDFNPKNKVIIFSELTSDVDEITSNTYHGKSDNDRIILDFNSGVIRELGVCKKVNRGVNFVGLNHCIAQSYSSSVTNAMQAYIGRMVRLDPSETAYIHFLRSTLIYGGEMVYAQNQNWLQQILSASELSHIDIVYYNQGL